MTPQIIIQARMGSTRFPGKVLAPLAGKPVISHVIDRAIQADVGDVMVAIPSTDENYPLSDYLRGVVAVWAGSESDVLGRFAEAADIRSDPIIRITGDCPLVDHRTIGALVWERDQRGLPYLGRTNDPDGNDVEVFTRDFLMEADRNSGQHQREHVTTWMRQHPAAVCIDHGLYRDVKYSIDTVEDLRTCEALIGLCGDEAPMLAYVAAYRTHCKPIGTP
jgi:spore coat polysaccharide biosynthesis protein SpsF (cytidylyltransferase family)